MVVPVTVAAAMAPVHLLSLGRRVAGGGGDLRLLGRRRNAVVVVMVKARLVLRRRCLVLDRGGLRAGVVVVLIRRHRGLRLIRRVLIHVRFLTDRVACVVMRRRVVRRVLHRGCEGERNDPQTDDCDKKSR